MLEEINQLALSYLKPRIFKSWKCKEFMKYGDIVVDSGDLDLLNYPKRFIHNGFQFVQIGTRFTNELVLPKRFTVCRFYRGIFIGPDYWPTKKVWFDHRPHREEIIANYDVNSQTSHFTICGKTFYIISSEENSNNDNEDNIADFEECFKSDYICLYTKDVFNRLLVNIYQHC